MTVSQAKASAVPSWHSSRCYENPLCGASWLWASLPQTISEKKQSLDRRLNSCIFDSLRLVDPASFANTTPRLSIGSQQLSTPSFTYLTHVGGASRPWFDWLPHDPSSKSLALLQQALKRRRNFWCTATAWMSTRDIPRSRLVQFHRVQNLPRSHSQLFAAVVNLPRNTSLLRAYIH